MGGSPRPARDLMKKSLLIALTLLAALPVLPAHAETGPLTLLIAGNKENNAFSIILSPDGREYRISSTLELETGGDICSHPEEIPTELACKATAIAGFEVNAGSGNDTVIFSSDIPIPVTIRGGQGKDRLIGGGASDKIIGGPDDDILVGRRGDDWILGGPGQDRLEGDRGNDQLDGGPGPDQLIRRAGTSCSAGRARTSFCSSSGRLAGRLRLADRPAADEGDRDQQADQRKRRIEPEGRLDAVGEGRNRRGEDRRRQAQTDRAA